MLLVPESGRKVMPGVWVAVVELTPDCLLQAKEPPGEQDQLPFFVRGAPQATYPGDLGAGVQALDRHATGRHGQLAASGWVCVGVGVRVFVCVRECVCVCACACVCPKA